MTWRKVTAPPHFADHAAGNPHDGVAIGDFNGDGRPDVALANNQSGSVSTLLNTGHGTFAAPVDHPSGCGVPGECVGGTVIYCEGPEGLQQRKVLPGRSQYQL